MKRRLLLTLLVWVSTFAKAQTNFPLLIGDQWLTEKAKQVIRFSNGDFLVAAHNNTTFTAGDGIHLSRYQSNGQLLWQKNWQKNLNVSGYHELLGLGGVYADGQNTFVLLDSVLMTVSFPSVCAKSYHTLVKLDQSGERIWTKSFEALYSNCMGLKGLERGHGDKLYLLEPRRILQLDTAGNLLNQRNLNGNNHTLVQTSGDEIMILRDNLAPGILVLDAQLDTLLWKTLSFNPQQAQVSGHYAYVTGTKRMTNAKSQLHIQKIDLSQGDSIWNTSIENFNQYQSNDIVLYHDTLYITGVVWNCMNTDTFLNCVGLEKGFVSTLDTNGQIGQHQYLEADIWQSHTYNGQLLIDSAYTYHSQSIDIDFNGDVLLLAGRQQFFTTYSMSHGVYVYQNAENLLVLKYPFGIPTKSGADLFVPEIQVYPNPVSDKIYLKTDEEHLDVQLWTIDGQVVYRGKDKMIDVHGLNAGIYFLALKAGGHTRVEKIWVMPE